MILSIYEQTRLRWWLRWSQADLGGLRSTLGGDLDRAEMNAKMTKANTNGIDSPDPKHRRAAQERVWRTLVIGADAKGGGEHQHAAAWFEGRDDVLASVSDEREVRRAVQAMGRELAELLVLAHGIDRLDRRAAFGPFGNLADRTPAAAEAWRRARSRITLHSYLDWLASVPAPDEDAAAEMHQRHRERRRIAADCEVLTVRADGAYLRALKDWRKLHPRKERPAPCTDTACGLCRLAS